MTDFADFKAKYPKIKDVYIGNKSYPSEQQDKALYNLHYFFKCQTKKPAL